MMDRPSPIKGILFDLDGVLYIGNTPIPQAIQVVNRLRLHGYICRFVTNTSTLSLSSLHQKMMAMGFDIAPSEIMSAPQAAIHYLKQHGRPLCRLLLAEDVKQDFNLFPQSDSHPEYIIIGDIGDAWSYRLLNELFNAMMQGAQVIAIHKNRFWQTELGLQLDIGAFITGLEYASQKKAMLIGKPAPAFFSAVLDHMQLSSDQTLMIGDDIDSDVSGAQAAGIQGVLVKTGKYRESYAAQSPIKPDTVLTSIAELPDYLVHLSS